MTNAPSDTPPRMTSLAPDLTALDEETRRAWVERMAVRSLGSGKYVVEDEGGAGHVVDLDRGGCPCRDHAPPEGPCRHVQRVAIEINLGRLPPPERSVECRACGERTTPDPAGDPPTLCEGCRLEPGDVVVDAEGRSASPLLVVAVTDRRADEARVPDADCTVAEYGPNRQYSPSDPVVEVVYPHSVRTDRPPRRYSFPLSRLDRPGGESDTVQATLTEVLAGE